MTLLASLGKSPVKGKRYRVVLKDAYDHSLIKIIDFASDEYENFTIHKDEERRAAYWKRHTGLSKEDMHDPLSAAFWSANLLWSKPTLQRAKNFIESKYDVKFI